MQTQGKRMKLAVGTIVLATSFVFAITAAAADKAKGSGSSGKRPEHPSQKGKQGAATDNATSDQLALLKKQLALQQKQIQELQIALQEQKQLLEQSLQAAKSAQHSPAAGPGTTGLGQVASLAPVVPSAGQPQEVAALGMPPGSVPVTQEQMQGYTQKVDQLDKSVETLNKGLGGFKFSGDFRLRSDNVFRSANSVAGAQQNVRGRYRLRFNVDRAVGDQIDAHLQLGSGTFNGPLTYDTDFNGSVARGPIFLSEVWGAYHPNSNIYFRGGRMSEVFADNARFLIDDDVRLDGFEEVIRHPFSTSSLGKVTLEFRGAQYIFTNPNVAMLPSTDQCSGENPPATCAYVAAGFPAGRKVPSTNMFDQGITVSAYTSDNVSHHVTVNFELWRNPTTIQLASLGSGYPLLANSFYGVNLAGPLGGAGNGTTTKGGAILTANSFHIGQVVYRLDYKGFKTSRQAFPISLEFHGARNFGADFYGNALMGQISAGQTKKFGEVAFKYGFFYKQANSMISQITDDDVGSGTGVNLKTHMIRIDLGLNKYLAWQNLLFIQNELAGNDPARNFYVNLQRGTSTQFRYQSQLQFTF
jgi:hypothetical protein